MFRRRRPLMRVAAGAATAGVAYHAGKRHAEEDAAPEAAAPAAPAPAAAAPAAAAPAAPASDDSVADLNRLVELHESGALDDDEFAAAKAKLLAL